MKNIQWKILSSLFLTFFIIKSSNGQVTQFCQGQQVVLGEDVTCDYRPYVLEFEDNFNGNSLDLGSWTLIESNQGPLATDDNLEYNTLDNVTVANGICKITAKKETVVRRAVSWKPDTEILSDGFANLRTFYYTGSNLWTKRIFGFGKYEIRCKIPYGKGIWPAFWMYGVNPNNGTTNEIDVFEFMHGESFKALMTTHYNNQQCQSFYHGPDYSAGYHTYTVIWDQHKTEWYIDGDLKAITTLFLTMNGQVVDCNGLYAFHQYMLNKVYAKSPMHIIMSLGIEKGDAPNASTPFPGSLEIDYIRYYRKMDCPGPLNVTDISQLNLGVENHNFFIGTTITASGNVVVPSNQLEFVGRDAVQLLPNFSTSAGTNFTARIDPGMCAGMAPNNISNINSDLKDIVYTVVDTDTENNQESSFTASIYPNPAINTFRVQLNSLVESNYTFQLYNTQGAVVMTEKNKGANNPIFNFNIKNLASGIYALKISNGMEEVIKKVYIGN